MQRTRSAIRFADEGATVNLRRSKTDQEGEGRKVGIPFGSSPALCPVRALRAWLDAAAIAEGPIFREVTRHGHVRAKLTRYAAARVGVRTRSAEDARLDGASLRPASVPGTARDVMSPAAYFIKKWQSTSTLQPLAPGRKESV